MSENFERFLRSPEALEFPSALEGRWAGERGL